MCVRIEQGAVGERLDLQHAARVGGRDPLGARRTVTGNQLAGLTWFSELAGPAATSPALLCGADADQQRGAAEVVGWRSVPAWAARRAEP